MNSTPISEGIISVLRGEANPSEEYEDLVRFARASYQAGKTGQPYEVDLPPNGLFPADVVEVMDNFLRRCWEQGRQEAQNHEN